jgi:hypothetical protein
MNMENLRMDLVIILGLVILIVYAITSLMVGLVLGLFIIAILALTSWILSMMINLLLFFLG